VLKKPSAGAGDDRKINPGPDVEGGMPHTFPSSLV
jgi:hypothetical protein